MARLPLNGRAYQERSVIASAQKTINLYAESNQDDPAAPTPFTYYRTPGLDLLSTPLNPAKCRCTYRTSKGGAYVVVGTNVYFLAVNNALVFVGSIPDRASQVYMADNGLAVVLVDGVGGWAIDIATNEFGPIIDPSFYGADFVVFLDTFFVFNRPATNQFYISLSNVNFAMLTGSAVGDLFVNANGTGGTAGVYQSVALTGGSGTDATGDVTVSNGIIATGHISAAGAAYIDGVYTGIPLTGGTGGGATADIAISGGAVTGVVFTNPGDLTGIDYTVADVLTADATLLGGVGAGFAYTIDSVVTGVSDIEIGNPGQGYLAGDILSANSADIGNVVGFQATIESIALAFDPLDIASKSGSADAIVAILTYHKELWLIGQLTSEVWQGTGAADFYFQLVQGAYIDHGSIAAYSAANTDVVGFWLMQDKVGKNIVVIGSNYEVTEISTPFLVNEFNNYETTADAIGFCFQQEQHAFYCLIFPTANKTWLYELETKQWNEWAFLNVDDGSLNRHRANCGMYFNGMNIVGDWETGNIYNLNNNTYTDNDTPIVRIKTFYHLVDNLDRVSYPYFDADIDVATQNPDIDTEPLIYLSWSDDRGKTYGFPVEQSMGKGGQNSTTVSWNRLGMARDRVFKLETSEPIDLAFNGGFSEPKKLRT